MKSESIGGLANRNGYTTDLVCMTHCIVWFRNVPHLARELLSTFRVVCTTKKYRIDPFTHLVISLQHTNRLITWSVSYFRPLAPLSRIIRKSYNLNNLTCVLKCKHYCAKFLFYFACHCFRLLVRNIQINFPVLVFCVLCVCAFLLFVECVFVFAIRNCSNSRLCSILSIVACMCAHGRPCCLASIPFVKLSVVVVQPIAIA